MALRREPELDGSAGAGRMEERNHGAALCPRQRRSTPGLDRRSAGSWYRTCTVRFQQGEISMTIKLIDRVAYPLGKGEVESSILSRSTSETPENIGFSAAFPACG